MAVPMATGEASLVSVENAGKTGSTLAIPATRRAFRNFKNLIDATSNNIINFMNKQYSSNIFCDLFLLSSLALFVRSQSRCKAAGASDQPATERRTTTRRSSTIITVTAAIGSCCA